MNLRNPAGPRRLAGAIVAAASLLVAGCAAPDANVGPRAAAATPRPELVSSVVAGLLPGVLSCPVLAGARTVADTAVIGPAGGRLAVGANAVAIPAGAVSSPETFVLTVPAGDLVQVDVRAEGYAHYQFAAPVTVTVDFARCGDLGLGGLLGGLLGGSRANLHGWYVDSETGAPLEDMAGVTDAVARTHTFRTPHFSNYLLAE